MDSHGQFTCPIVQWDSHLCTMDSDGRLEHECSCTQASSHQHLSLAVLMLVAITSVLQETDARVRRPQYGNVCSQSSTVVNVLVPQLDLFDSLFEANGRKALLFYYQLADTPVSYEFEYCIATVLAVIHFH